MRYAIGKIADPEIHRLGAQARSLPPPLESLLAYWLRKSGARRMPGRDELPVQELQPWLGHLAVIEIAGDGAFRVRLAGIELIRRLGREATGASVNDLAFDIAKQLTAILKATAKAMAPVVAVSPVALGRMTSIYCEIALPLSGPDGRLAAVLLGSYPVRDG